MMVKLPEFENSSMSMCFWYFWLRCFCLLRTLLPSLFLCSSEPITIWKGDRCGRGHIHGDVGFAPNRRRHGRIQTVPMSDFPGEAQPA